MPTRLREGVSAARGSWFHRPGLGPGEGRALPTFAHRRLLRPLSLRRALNPGGSPQQEALVASEAAGGPDGELWGLGARVTEGRAAGHRAVPQRAEDAAGHSWNTGTLHVSRSGWAISRKERAQYTRGGRLPLHVGFSVSQAPDEVHWRCGGPTSSNPSLQRNVQLVFHGRLPELREQSTNPSAGPVRASHSTTGERGPWV